MVIVSLAYSAQNLLKIEGNGGVIMYTALDVAHYAITKCFTENHPISNLQLQKILYYIQRSFLQADSIAFDEDFEAWRFGPVIPSVYRVYCGFAGTPIRLKYEMDKLPDFEADYKARMDSVINEKRDISPWDLVRETHHDGGAWKSVYQNGIGEHWIIYKDLIKTRG